MTIFPKALNCYIIEDINIANKSIIIRSPFFLIRIIDVMTHVSYHYCAD